MGELANDAAPLISVFGEPDLLLLCVGDNGLSDMEVSQHQIQ